MISFYLYLALSCGFLAIILASIIAAARYCSKSHGALITYSNFGKQYEMGQYKENSTTLYVTRGLGMEGSVAPRARFLCPPELVVIDLKMENSP